jgi:hypothetical protein
MSRSRQLPWLQRRIVSMDLGLTRAVRRKQTVKGE